MVLSDILREKIKEARRLRDFLSPREIEKRIQFMEPPRDFKCALRDKNFSIIAEFKRRSPSSGWIRRDADPVSVAISYEKSGASAISIITDQFFFGGSMVFLEEVRKSVSLPLLRKDFLLDLLQIYQSRIAGADCVLLIVAMLNKALLKEMISLTGQLGMSALVEVHSRDELEMALDLGVEIVGINNRNLKTMEVDLKTTLDLAPLVPEGVIVVSESGIKSGKDLRLLMSAGVRAFLVGEELMRAQDPAERLRAMMEEAVAPMGKTRGMDN